MEAREDLIPPVYSCGQQPGWHNEWFYIRNPSRREEAFLVFTRSAPEKQDSWISGASRRKKNNVGAIEEVL